MSDARTQPESGSTRSRRLLAGAAVLLVFLAVHTPSRAQTTIRFEPDITGFPLGTRTPIEIFVDNVPSGGFQGFDLIFEYSTSGLTTCLGSPRAVIDPNLSASLGGVLSQQFSTAGINRLRWSVATRNPAAFSPSGGFRLGSISFVSVSGPSFPNCFEGVAGIFRWDPSATTYLPKLNGVPASYQVRRDGAWYVGDPQDLDLEIACSRLAPPDDLLSDGDIITLDCAISNLGTADLPEMIGVGSVLSADAAIDPADRLIDHRRMDIPPPGGISSIILSGSPLFPVIPGQVLQICAQADLNSKFTDAAVGGLLETDETNNSQCFPATVVAPTRDLSVQSLGATPGPSDPNALRVGTAFDITYTLVNLGTAGVRRHRNAVFLSVDPVIGDAPDIRLCDLDEPDAPPLPGRGGTRTRTFGTGEDFDPVNDLVCDIPFDLPEGDYFLGVVADIDGQVVELDETNNTGSLAVRIEGPADPSLDVVDPYNNDSRNLQITGPGGKFVAVRMASVRDLVEYELTIQWSPPELMRIDYPSFSLSYSGFLQQNGRQQACDHSAAAINNAQGKVTLSCVTTGTEPGASSAGTVTLAYVYFFAALPGTGGTIRVTGVRAVDSTGGTMPVRTLDGSFSVIGVPHLFVSNVVAPQDAVPGPPFTVAYEIENVGFGASAGGLRTDVILSTDTLIDVTSGDRILCFFPEPLPLQPFTTVSRTLTDCVVPIDLRPGTYTLALSLTGEPPVKESLELLPRVAALTSDGEQRRLEIYRPPRVPGDQVGGALASYRRFDARSIGMIKSSTLRQNFLFGRGRSAGEPVLNAYALPKAPRSHPERLGRLRVPGRDRAVLGGADVDGDGEDELILLQRGSGGDRLDFRRVGQRDGRPLACVTAALTAPFRDTVVDAAGIRFDADPNDDEIAVLTERDGKQTLTIYDFAFDPNGPPPPSSDLCTGMNSRIPDFPAALLVPLASDRAFGSVTQRARAICVLDLGTDGVDEIVALIAGADRSQSLGVFEPPPILSGKATLVADDPAFGGLRRKALDIACTR